VALSDRVAKALFPELTVCWEQLLHQGDWAAVAQAVDVGHAAAQRHAADIVGIYTDGKRCNSLAGVEARIDSRLGKYLGTPD